MTKLNATRSKLVPATIYPVNEEGKLIAGVGIRNSSGAYNLYKEDFIVSCLFNPEAYTIKKKNKFTTGGYDTDHGSRKNYKLEFKSDKIEPRTLTLSALWFETAEPIAGHENIRDVRDLTDPLFEYVEVQAPRGLTLTTYRGSLNPPPAAAFEWGSFRFLGVVTSVKVDFTLFARDGTPIQAKATVSFKEFRQRAAYPNQNPSSRTAQAEKFWFVTDGDRLDTIAAKTYGDATLWRPLARHNAISDPLALQPGQRLSLPARWQLVTEAGR